MPSQLPSGAAPSAVATASPATAHELVPGPDEEPALDALAVRVLGGEERPLGVPELAEQVLAGLGGDAAVALEAGHLPRVHVQPDQQCVVVQHLLEVWDVPSFVRRVPVEAAAHLVVHPAGGHLVQRDRHHVERVGRPSQVHPQAELQGHGLGELRRAAEPSPARVERAPEPPEGRHEDRLRERLRGGPEPGRPLDRLGDLRALLLCLGTAVGPHVRDGRQDRPEGGEAVAGLGRVVGAGVERFALRGQEGGEGPSASAGHRLDGVHVDRVQVGAFLPIDLDRDEVPVHQRGGLDVLEAFALHDVAPVTGRVADREQDRLVLGAGPLERLLAPRVPVHGVLGVLEQIRARLVREAIHGSRASLGRRSHVRTPTQCLLLQLPAIAGRWLTETYFPKKVSATLMAPGPRITMNKAGSTMKIMGNRSFSGTFWATSSAR